MAECKRKGLYAESGFQKTPSSDICVDAVIEYLDKGTPIEETIRSCRDIRKFVTVRTVNGGAEYFEDAWGQFMPIGKAIRWYYSVNSTGPIRAMRDASKVPKSDGAIPCMELPDVFPNDVDYARYVAEARSILADLGIFRTFNGRQKKIALKELLRLVMVL